jgi:geranylgeranyl pyrophosphate synthase
MSERLLPEALHIRKRLIENHLDEMLTCGRAPESRVGEAMRYAVLNGGQRVRPLLALGIADVLGAESALTLRAGLAVELIHCASLIVDDLPSMDDSPTRRGQPSTHVRFGEATAILAAFSLVAKAARSVIPRNAAATESVRLLQFQSELLGVLDCDALVGGQEMDLALDGSSRESLRATLNELKTAPLFLLAVRAGLLHARLSSSQNDRLLKFGRAFGIAFQTTDDYLDGECPDLNRVTSDLEAARAFLPPRTSREAVPHLLLDYLYARAIEKSHCYR